MPNDELKVDIPKDAIFNLQVSFPEYQLIINALDELPGKISRPLVQSLAQRMMPQVQKYTVPKEE